MSVRERAMTFALAVLAVLVAGGSMLGLAGCGGSDVNNAAPTTAAPGTAGAADFGPATHVSGPAVTVKAIDNDFEPKNVVVKPGTKVTFDNTGHNFHDVVPIDKAKLDFTIDQSKFSPGTSATFTFDKPGTYTYYCSLHATATAGDMRGEITVEG